MSGESTLIVTTRSGVRPLGVRGEPLHNSAVQLGRIVRRRLGDAVAGLLAEPQLHADGKGIDWYASWTGEVRRVVDLDPKERGEILAQVDRGLIEISQLGQSLSTAGEDTGVIGRSLQLAAKRPAESFVFLVGDKPVVVCWGYEKEAANGLLPPTLPAAVARRPVLDTPSPTAVRPVIAGASAASIPWVRTLLFALPLLALLLGGIWLLRDLLPAAPALAIATKEGPDAPPPVPPVDRRPILKASLSQEQARAKALQIEMTTIENELKKRIGECKPATPPPPPAPPKPPPQASVAPPPKPAPPPQPRPPSDNRLRLPTGPTRDYSFLQGCWRSDPFRHETAQFQPGVSSYCFDSSGYGELEWRRGRVACRTGAQARFDGSTLRLHDRDTTCNDGSHWFADQLICQRGADNVAQCSGYSQGSFGPTRWTVNLHKLN